MIRCMFAGRHEAPGRFDEAPSRSLTERTGAPFTFVRRRGDAFVGSTRDGTCASSSAGGLRRQRGHGSSRPASDVGPGLQQRGRAGLARLRAAMNSFAWTDWPLPRVGRRLRFPGQHDNAGDNQADRDDLPSVSDSPSVSQPRTTAVAGARANATGLIRDTSPMLKAA